MASLESVLRAVAAGQVQPAYLVTGDLVLALPAAERLAAALAAAVGCAVESHRRPARLTPLLEDLRTYSLFSTGKVLLVAESALTADRASAAELVDQAAEGLPLAGDELSPRGRQGASRLLQALRLFGVDPARGDPAAVVGELPAWALQGGETLRRRSGGRGRAKGDVEELRRGLAQLLAAARAAEIQGWADTDLSELAAVVAGGLPRGHALVLAESAASSEHPIVASLAAAGALVDVGRVEVERSGFAGAELLARELERQTGAGIAPEALAELARRTLRERQGRGWGGGEGVDPDSTQRFAAEYRKLADLAGGERIERELVEEAVEDRGQEDVWKLLDAAAEGRADDALDRLARLLRSADDPVAARLAFFSMFAGFCRQLAAVGEALALSGAPRGERSYNAFKARIAPALQGELPGGKNPLAGIHPFRLHRAYLAACRMPPADLPRLPWRVLETELRMKGESGEADAALFELVAGVAAAVSAPAAAGSRER
jgi:DNA polymerase-3 subunit delta